MVTPLESGIFDSIAGLPVHPLVVHFAVVLLPLAALGLVVLVAVPRWADRFGWLTLATLAVGTGAAFVAKESGEALAHRVGEPEAHAAWGDLLPLAAVGLLVLAGAWFFLHRRAGGAGARRSVPATVVGVLAAILAVAVTGLTVLVGHSGAQAAWAGVISAPNDQPSAPTSASAGGSTSPSAKPGASPGKAAHTMADVAAHASASSCWSVVDKQVYDLTKWIDQHPGGSRRILDMCGKDATAAFNAQHGGQNRPERILKQYLVGPLG
jgi:uncharacterized membrane protein